MMSKCIVSGVDLISAERARQVSEEGWTPEHDDEHGSGELAMAACCYASPGRIFVRHDFARGVSFGDPWPWGTRWDKRPPQDCTAQERIRALSKAGALIAAEIDRLVRASDVSAAAGGREP